jgi:hypothetical protein
MLRWGARGPARPALCLPRPVPVHVGADGLAPIVVGSYSEDVYCTCNVRRRLLHSRCCMLIARRSPDVHELRGPGEAKRRDIRLDGRAPARSPSRRSPRRSSARSRPRLSRSSRYSRSLALWSRPRPRCMRTASSVSTPATLFTSGSLSERSDERTRKCTAALAFRLDP